MKTEKIGDTFVGRLSGYRKNIKGDTRMDVIKTLLEFASIRSDIDNHDCHFSRDGGCEICTLAYGN